MRETRMPRVSPSERGRPARHGCANTDPFWIEMALLVNLAHGMAVPPVSVHARDAHATSVPLRSAGVPPAMAA